MVIDPAANPGSARESWTRPTARVDWLQGSIAPDDGDGVGALEVWLTGERETCGQPVGVFGYDRWHKDAAGTLLGLRIGAAPPGERRLATTAAVRAFLILKGTGLAHLRAADVDDREALDRFCTWGGDCTRVDLAVDVLHPGVTPRAIRDLFESNRLVTRLRSPRYHGTPEDGDTWYIGAKDVTVRVYNKSAERARVGVVLPEGITRLEMQLRKRSAKAAVRKLVGVPRDRWDSEFPRLVSAWLLDKVRPTVAPVGRNPNRVATWTPLCEALQNVGPVRLGRDEKDRATVQQIAAKLLHFTNNLNHLRWAQDVLGRARFLQAIDTGKLDGTALFLAQFAQEDPKKLAEILAALGLDAQPEKPEDPQRCLS